MQNCWTGKLGENRYNLKCLISLNQTGFTDPSMQHLLQKCNQRFCQPRPDRAEGRWVLCSPQWLIALIKSWPQLMYLGENWNFSKCHRSVTRRLRKEWSLYPLYDQRIDSCPVLLLKKAAPNASLPRKWKLCCAWVFICACRNHMPNLQGTK